MRALVAVDIFDPGHEKLLEEVVAWAERLSATLDLGYIDGVSYLRAAILDQKIRDLLDEEMERLKEQREGILSGLVASMPASVQGAAQYRYDQPVVDAFLELAADYDLVVVGTHGRQGMRRFFLGSFAEKVVRRSPVPVLVLRDGSAEF